MFKLFVLEEGYDYSAIKQFVEESVKAASERFDVTIMFMMDEQNDQVTMNVFNAETIESLIMQTVDYFLKDLASCYADDGEMIGTMSIEFK